MSRSRETRVSFLTIIAVLFGAGLAIAQQTSPPPNVILIMTDDQGYGDLSITGNAAIETPNMDRLAKEGVWFKQFYVSPVCTPTRAHLMTGRYNFRNRAIDTYLGRAVMEPEEVTLAEVLTEAGYATGIFGKWHLGDYFPTRAIDQGFQEAVVHQGGGLRQPANPPEGERYHDPILSHNGEFQQYEGYCTDIYFDQAASFIEQNASNEKPFFVYLPTNAPHGPFDEPPTRELMEHFKAKFPDDQNDNRSGFYAMIKNVDENIGRLLETLVELGIEQNTLVIFLTDNGPSAGSAGPFRGMKSNVYEGGIRTVCFLRWPGLIEAGSTVSFPGAHLDLMPTILDFCNIPLPDNVQIDGRSLRPLIAEQGEIKTQGWPDRYLFLQWHRGEIPQRYHNFAVVGPQGKWKLLSSGRTSQHIPEDPPGFALFDLENDISEKHNIAHNHPDIVERFKAEYDAWFDDVTHTREPNFGMPPIVIGSDEQPTTILTSQDKRVDEVGGEGWWAPGHWPVDIRDEGPYTVHILLNENTTKATEVHLTLQMDGEQWTKSVTIPRGVDAMAVGNITLPRTGQGRIVGRIVGEEPAGPHVFQLTFK